MRNSKLLIFSLLALLTTVSCKKWLDLKPQDGLIREEFWQTKEQIEAATVGIYSSMLGSTSGDLALPEYFFIWGEARTDMVLPGFRADASELDMVNVNIQQTNRFANWRAIYQTINYCNTLIELAPGVSKKDNTLTDEQLNRSIGEALTIRSLMYFYLARVFRDVPLKLDATISDENITPIPKSTSDSVLKQIVSDLKKAQPYLPETYGNLATDKGRVTRYTANALLADVYLWMEKYQECIDECQKIIDSKRFGLISGEASAVFNSLFFEGNSNESIFELQFSTQKLNPFYNMHHPTVRRWGAAPHLTEEVYGIDKVNAIPQVDLRGENISYRAADLTIWKYIGANAVGTSIRAFDQSFAHWIFYRYADVLLMKAEALNQLNKPSDAALLVQQIRTRANAIDFSTPMNPNSKQDMEEFILEERQREFAFEGKRWFDVLRNAKRNSYDADHLKYLLRMAAVSVPPDRQQTVFNKLKDPNSHYMPVYLYELQTNKLLVQNPFYK
jgi:hypothetical protein